MPRLSTPTRSTRRWLLLLAVGVAGGYLAGLLSPGALGMIGGAFAPPPILASGVVTFDRAHTDTGYVTVGVIPAQSVDLVAKDGRIVHTWHLPHPLAGMATMDPDGSLLYLGKMAGDTGGPKGGAAGVLERISWDSQVLWTMRDPLINHDFAELPDGRIAVIRWDRLSPELASQIPGGIAGSEFTGGVTWGDQIVEIDPTTQMEEVVFDVAEAWRPQDHPLPAFMPRSEWAHANSLFYVPSDPITGQEAYLISFRDISTIFLVSRRTGQVIWSYGGLWVLDQQHDATLVSNGHVLLFDNGEYRPLTPASQVLEIDPTSDEVVWSYQGYGIVDSAFYSPITGGAQRLANGNTLVTLGTKGQVLEVTTDGTIVWDYRDRSGPVDPAYPAMRVSFLFKSRSYPASEVDPLLRGG